jgi:hypothetical protein
MLLGSVDLDKSLERDGGQIRVGIPDQFTQRPARPRKTSPAERKNGGHPALRERMAECPEKTIIERRANRSPNLQPALLARP